MLVPVLFSSENFGLPCQLGRDLTRTVERPYVFDTSWHTCRMFWCLHGSQGSERQLPFAGDNISASLAPCLSREGGQDRLTDDYARREVLRIPLELSEVLY